MRKADLKNAVGSAKAETKTMLQIVYEPMNQGQQKKIVKDDTVKALLDRYGVKYATNGEAT